PAARLLAAATVLGGLLAGGCGGVLVGAASPAADLRVEGPVTVRRQASGAQTLVGTVVNLGPRRADAVEVTLTLFVQDPSGRPVPWVTIADRPVVSRADGTQTLFPGSRGDFVVVVEGVPPVVDLDVEIAARLPPDGTLVVFFVTPGLFVIIVG
ncbi:MAG TPA: hypothetical protein VNM66_03515, partial [Thermodesulfobacteriota bacterium]|nr:hypothetical protein [Thermodesulfobacteriota bacterium]